jgi:hypothetical protein
MEACLSFSKTRVLEGNAEIYSMELAFIYHLYWIVDVFTGPKYRQHDKINVW